MSFIAPILDVVSYLLYLGVISILCIIGGIILLCILGGLVCVAVLHKLGLEVDPESIKRPDVIENLNTRLVVNGPSGPVDCDVFFQAVAGKVSMVLSILPVDGSPDLFTQLTTRSKYDVLVAIISYYKSHSYYAKQ